METYISIIFYQKYNDPGNIVLFLSPKRASFG